jgi:hypothetical protein
VRGGQTFALPRPRSRMSTPLRAQIVPRFLVLTFNVDDDGKSIIEFEHASFS